MVILTGAEPTLDGGGELALESEADVTEALSEMASLVGVPGRSCLDIEARLGWREGKTGGNVEVTDDGVALPAVGVSAFEGTSRKVFGVFRTKGDCAEIADGVLGGKGGNAEAAVEEEADEEATVDLLGGSEGVVVVLSAGFEGTEILRIPGGGRFSLLGAVGVATTTDAGVGVAGAVFLLLTAGVLGGLLGVTGGALAFPESKAGKSSD